MLCEINPNRFAVKGVVGSSIGGIYACVANLPRDKCFLRKYTALLGVIPGPKEPSRSCLNRILEPLVEDFLFCERGFETFCPTYGQSVEIQTRLLFNASDLLATRKLVGSVGLSNKNHPCHHCAIVKSDINDPKGYNWHNLPAHTPEDMLKAAFEYEVASPERQAQLENDYGVRFSPMARLAQFEHASSSPVDPLHNSFLGLVKSFVNQLFVFELFEDPDFHPDWAGMNQDESSRDSFKAVFENSIYPGHLGRLPNRVTRQFVPEGRGKRAAGGGLKADQWKRIAQLLPLALYAAWRGANDDDIEDYEPEDPDDESGKRRSRWGWYQAATALTASLRTLHAHSLSVEDAEHAVTDISDVAKAILSFGGHLTINWHIAMHYPRCVQLFGPLSGFGTWAFERNNGVLANINHNGREVDIASTCLRRWILESRLAAIINNPAPNATDVEIAALKTLLLNRVAIMGTLMLQEARGNAATRTIRLPVPYQKGRPVDLHLWDAYAPLLSYLNAERPEFQFIDAAFFMDPRPSLPTRSQGYRIYTHAVYNGFK